MLFTERSAPPFINLSPAVSTMDGAGYAERAADRDDIAYSAPAASAIRSWW